MVNAIIIDDEQNNIDNLESLLHKYCHEVQISGQYKNRVTLLESIEKITDLYSFRSLHFKKLKGEKSGQSSIRLNDQYHLIIEQVNDGVVKI